MLAPPTTHAARIASTGSGDTQHTRKYTHAIPNSAKRNERLPYDEQDLAIANLTWSDAGNRKKQADIIAIGAAMRAHVKSALALRDGARTTSSSPAAAAPSQSRKKRLPPRFEMRFLQ